jgi:hypothetical protein
MRRPVGNPQKPVLGSLFSLREHLEKWPLSQSYLFCRDWIIDLENLIPALPPNASLDELADCEWWISHGNVS